MESTGVLVFSIILGVIGAFIAHKKNRNRIIWFIVSAIFMFPILIVVFLPKASKGEADGEEDASAVKKPLPVRKIATVTMIVLFASVYAFVLEAKKDETALSARQALDAACNSDAVCLEMVEKNFDGCIEQHLTIKKTGRKSREIDLDMQALQLCVGLNNEK